VDCVIIYLNYHSFFASMDEFFPDLFKLYRVAMPENLFGKAHSLVCTIPTSIAAICTE
jgi:predicted small integral membrane protein